MTHHMIFSAGREITRPRRKGMIYICYIILLLMIYVCIHIFKLLTNVLAAWSSGIVSANGVMSREIESRRV
jgi:hypothetical protein